MFRSFAFATLLASATVAQAASFTSVAGNPDPGPAAGQTVVFDFNSATPELTGMYSLVTGTGSGAAAPAGDLTQYAAVPTIGLPSGTATLDLTGLAGPIGSFSFYWGSIDTYNSIELLNGANSFYTLSGSMLPPATGDQGSGATNRRVFVTLGAGEAVTAIRFNSSGVAFEFDDFAVGGVPEPETWAMMLLGFGLVGVSVRRRRPTSVTA